MVTKCEFNASIAKSVSELVEASNATYEQVSLASRHSAGWLRRKTTRKSSFGLNELAKVMAMLDCSSNSRKINHAKGRIRRCLGYARPPFHMKKSVKSADAAMRLVFSEQRVIDVARKSGISVSAVSMYKTGKRDIPLYDVARILSVLPSRTTRSAHILDGLDDYLFRLDKSRLL